MIMIFNANDQIFKSVEYRRMECGSWVFLEFDVRSYQIEGHWELYANWNLKNQVNEIYLSWTGDPTDRGPYLNNLNYS